MIKGHAKACLRGFGNDPQALPSAFTGDRLWRGPFLRAFAPIRPGDKTGNKTGSEPVVNRQPSAAAFVICSSYGDTGFVPDYRRNSLFFVKTRKRLQASRFRHNPLSLLDFWDAFGTPLTGLRSRRLQVRALSGIVTYDD